MPKHWVLVVEDEPLIAMQMTDHVESHGHAVCGWASSADTAIALAVEKRPTVILMDVRLAGERDGSRRRERSRPR